MSEEQAARMTAVEDERKRRARIANEDYLTALMAEAAQGYDLLEVAGAAVRILVSVLESTGNKEITSSFNSEDGSSWKSKFVIEKYDHGD